MAGDDRFGYPARQPRRGGRAKDVCEALPAQVTTLDCNLTNEKPAFNVRYCVEFNKAVTLLSSFTFLIGTSQLC